MPMFHFTLPSGPRLLAAFGGLSLLAGLGLVSSRPAHTAGGPIAVNVANTPLATTTTDGTPAEGYIEVSDNSLSSFSNVLYTVPTGKRLTVNTLTLLSTFISTADGYTAVVLHEDASGHIISIFTLSAGPGTGAVTGTTQAVRFQAGPGEKLLVNVFKTGSGGIDAYVSLSGSLKDAS